MKLENLCVLVTGGAGFIGSNIVEYLLKNGAKFVRIMDNLSTGSMNNINSLLDKFDNVEFFLGDITNAENCHRACKGISAICHQAALSSVPKSMANPLDTHNINVNGFINILLAAREHNIKRIVYASSSSVYGTNDTGCQCEDHIGAQVSSYAVTKYINELYANIFTKTYGLECIGLRYFNVYGPRQDPNGDYALVIPKFIKLISSGQRPIIYGDGTYVRDFIYVDDVVGANILALTTSNTDCFGQVFNVGTNNAISINNLFQLLVEIIGSKCEPIYGPVRDGDAVYTNASIDKIYNYLGYKPVVDFREGLYRTIEYFSH